MDSLAPSMRVAQLPGDDDFLVYVAAVHRAGHIITAEALERESLHKLIERSRGERVA